MNKTTCSLAAEDGPCGPVYGHGWCNKHYCRWRKHGDPLTKASRGNGGLIAELRGASRATTNECLILPAPSGGRPMINHNGTQMATSRAVWIIAKGDPGEKHVLHTCHRGQEGCANIRHLYLGDHERNMLDRDEAGRNVRGEDVGTSKLTAQQVQEIRKLHAAGTSFRAVAARYGVSRSAIEGITTGRTWAWLPADLD